MFKGHVRNSLFVFFLLIFCLLSNHPCLANAETSGLENPEKKPLHFVSIVLEDGSNVNGASQLPLNPSFKLEFDKNVVNDSIWDNNKNCFKLSDASGKNIPLNVSRINDTVDFTQRDFIFVQISSHLEPGTQYQLHISPVLVAKNLNSLGASTGGEEVVINFKTAGIPAEQETYEATVPESDTDSVSPEEKQLEDESDKITEAQQLKEEVQVPASEEMTKASLKQEDSIESIEEKETAEQIRPSLTEKEENSRAESSKDFQEENESEPVDNGKTALWVTVLGILALLSFLFYLKFKR